MTIPGPDDPELAHIAPELRGLARPIAGVLKDAANLNLHDKRSIDGIRSSLAEFAQRKNIVLQRKPDGTLLVRAGNGTIDALLALGKKWVAAIEVEEGDVTATRFAISDNRTAQLSKWDLPALSSTLEALDYDVPGCDQAWLEEIAGELGEPPPGGPSGPGDPGPGELPEDPKSEAGRVYGLGPHRIACGDSTSKDLVAELLSGSVINMVWTDPPFGVDYDRKNEMLKFTGRGGDHRPIEGDVPDGERRGKGEAVESAARICLAALKLAAERTLPGGVIYVATGIGTQVLSEFFGAVARAGFLPKWALAWDKGTTVIGRADYLPQHENIIYGWKPGRGHFFSGYFRRTIFAVPKPSKSELHPTMKPVDLIEPMILNSSKEGWSVYDPFTGSGSTLIACGRSGRKFLGVEVDPGYVDVIRKRWGDWAREAKVDPGKDAL